MKWSELRQNNSYKQIAEGTGLDRSYFSAMEKHRGFSKSALKKLKEKYPSIDINDLIMNYPTK